MTIAPIAKLEALIGQEEAVVLHLQSGHTYCGYIRAFAADTVLVRGHRTMPPDAVIRSYHVVAAHIESFYLLSEVNAKGPVEWNRRVR